MQSCKEKVCCFCKSSNDELKLGKMYTYGDLTVHYFCLLLSPNLCQSGEENEGILGFMPSCIRKELTRAYRLKCYICNKNGANLGCCDKKCRRSFHLPCGIRQECINQFFGLYESFCNDHVPRQISSVADTALVKKSGNPIICGICHDKIKPRTNYNTLWTTCCRNGWFHRDCVMKMAVNNGCHFFRCPLCNNKDDFIQEMQKMGIYVPDQDASWELEPHAFEDLYQKRDQCDLEKCRCPWGRRYSKKGSQWSLRLCYACGSSGAHKGCRKQSGLFYCTLCHNVYNRYSLNSNNTTESDGSFTSDKASSNSDCEYSNSINKSPSSPKTNTAKKPRKNTFSLNGRKHEFPRYALRPRNSND